jgi:hypothetical protein
MIDNKTSLLIPQQLPEFIRDNPDYEKFVLFLQAYYEWMEQNNNVIDRSKNILNYIDIDRTSEDFLNYFYNDFLQYFPLDMLADKTRVIKIAKELYKSKGTPAAYKFLFRILYNSDVDFFNTGEAVLRASSGKWYVSKGVKLRTTDTNFLYTNNLRLFGETSKSIATIESSTIIGNKIQIFLSNIQRTFLPGEFIRVVDENNQTLYFKDGKIVDGNTENSSILRSKIVTQISKITIDPKYRGQKYLVGDPVVVYNGTDIDGGIEATAHVSSATKGAIRFFRIENAGQGYVAGLTSYPSNSSNSSVTSKITISGALGAVATVYDVDQTSSTGNATYISIDTVSKLANVSVSNTTYSLQSYTTNANTKLVNALNFVSFPTYPIKTVVVNNGGGGITGIPTATVDTEYTTNYENNISVLSNLGILAPIQIIPSTGTGKGYVVGDTVVLSGGSGFGAYANVTSVNANGSITKVSYMYGDSQHIYPLGGMGYRVDALPTITVNSSNVLASNASLVVTGIMGAGAQLNPQTDRVGSITEITIDNYGEEYVSSPDVSLKVQDIFVTGVDNANLPMKGDIIYQQVQASDQELLNVNVATFIAIVDSIELLYAMNPDTYSTYKIRVFNYTSKADAGAGTLKIDRGNIELSMSTRNLPINYSDNYISDARFDPVNGVLIYGDGSAKAYSQYLNGLVLSQGEYLDSTGHPSSFDILQSSDYNNFTYEITVEKEIQKYRKVLLELLHPAGLKVLGRYAIRSENLSKLTSYSSIRYGKTLSDANVDHASYANITKTSDKPTSNVIVFPDIAGANIANVIFKDSYIQISNSVNGNILTYSKVNAVNPLQYENLLVFSQNFDRSWNSANTTIIPNVAIAPDGSLGASIFIANGNDSYVNQNTTINTLNSTQYTFSVWMKADSTLSANIFLTDSGTNSYTACSIGNNWQRFSVTRTTPASRGNTFVQIGGANTFTTGEKIYVWGPQLELGSIANNYYPSVISFTSRANTGTYTSYTGYVKTALVDEPRYRSSVINLNADPYPLLESAANNLILYSEDLRNTAEANTSRPWGQASENPSIFGQNNVAIRLISTTDPTGATSNVSKLTQNTASANTDRYVYQLPSSIANNNICTVSVFAKAAEVKNIRLIAYTKNRVINPYTIINLTTGNITYTSANVLSSGIIKMNDGWYRCWVTANVFSGSNNAGVSIMLNGNKSTYTYYNGAVGDGVLLWGAQAEYGYGPTSYIPTTKTTLNRAADIATSTKGIHYPTVSLDEDVWLTYPSVALVSGNAGSNVVTVKSLTGSYDYINNGNYSNTSYPLYDIVNAGDTIYIANNLSRTVKTIDAVNGIITVDTNLTSNVGGSNGFMSINRNISEIADFVKIYGPIGVEYLSEIGTEDGNNIATETRSIITIE